MKTTINRNLLKYAVQTAIFCRLCKHVLDIRSAVLIETPKSTLCVCSNCWNQHSANFQAAASREQLNVTILDGRELFARRKGNN